MTPDQQPCFACVTAWQPPMTVSLHNNSSPPPSTQSLSWKMCDFRDFTQNGLWSGQGDRYARSVSVVGQHEPFLNISPQFPDMNREYCVVRRCATPARMDSALLPYCSSTADDLRRMKRELYSPGPMDSEGLYPMERKMLLPLQSSFSPDVQQICFPRARRDILSIEREIDERSWAALEGRMRIPPEFPGQAFSIPRS